MTTVRPLCSTGVPPLHHYYGPLRLPQTEQSRLCFSSKPSRYDLQAYGSPRFQTDLSPRAVPKHPGEPCRCKRWFLHGMYGLHHFWQDGHSHRSYEAESGSLSLRLMDSSTGASTAPLPVTAVRFPTYSTNNLYGKLLSAYKISQA